PAADGTYKRGCHGNWENVSEENQTTEQISEQYFDENEFTYRMQVVRSLSSRDVSKGENVAENCVWVMLMERLLPRCSDSVDGCDDERFAGIIDEM
ncbi:26061_t:CDS:2, partial [Gigaspora margarita]